MLRIGLTGGIGAGKSAVATRLADRGARVIDADAIARQVVEPGTEGLAALVERFGADILTPQGVLDRPALAAVAFTDDDARAELNAIVHPLVGAETGRRLRQAEADAVAVVVQDIPLLVENGLTAAFPLVIVVDAPVDVRLRRLAARSAMTEHEALARMAAQASTEQRRAAADVWIDNDGDLASLHDAVDRLWDGRLLPFAENLAAGRRAERGTRAVIVDPDPIWAAQGERLVARVRAAAGERAHRVDHIGSTSVPGLPAKDVLDVQVVVDDLDTARAVADDLVAAGLVHLAGDWCDPRPEGGEAAKRMAANADPRRAVNCHVRPRHSPNVGEALLLPAWLRAHPQEAAEYARVKREVSAGDYATVNEYAERKSVYLRPALGRAQRWADATGWRA